MAVQILLGNEALALGMVESDCRVVTAYPGTPSSEILAGVVKYKRLLGRDVYTEWSANEKVAFEVALAASWTGLRAAVAMKQVGLNVAADPLFSSAYTGVKGGFIIVAADDPGPISSQTEQDSRLMALNAKVPVFDPASPTEARAMIEHAFDLSEAHSIPVMVRPTTRLCHALQSMPFNGDISASESPGSIRFRKEPLRWTATPKLRHLLHIELNNKLQQIEELFETSPLNFVAHEGSSDRIGIIASGVVFNTARQAILELGVEVPLLKVGTPYPLPRRQVSEFIANFQTVVVLEEPNTGIELQIPDRTKIRGRLNGFVPTAGELTPEAVTAVLAEALKDAGFNIVPPILESELQSVVDSLALPILRPRLCPGCSHRSAFYAMKREFGGRAIYPGDIGCYTLGTNLRAVDTIVDMGASVTMADGLYQAARLVGDTRPIVASIGDSTFLHSGVGALINAVHTGARFVLVILDNHTTAMTGFQPTPGSDYLADGGQAAHSISIPELVRACGVSFVEITDPYDYETFRKVLRQAYQHSQNPNGSLAVIIADRPCVLYDRSPLEEHPIPVEITQECDGCRYCLEAFECPAIVLRADGSRVDINESICVLCGQCIDACYKGYILPVLPLAEEIHP